MKLLTHWLALLLYIMVLGSCTTTKPVQYLDRTMDTTAPSELQVPEPVIQKNDLLSIIVYSANPSASALYNQAPVAGAANPGATLGITGYSATATSGYLVDNEGNINVTGVGPVKAEGMTKKQLSAYLINYFTKDSLLTNPVIEIRFLNYKVTLLGEVARPGVYNIPTEKVTVLEAVGLAGDLTIYAKKENVTVIREVNGVRELGRLDLSSSSIFTSPYYYLQQNDVVIVDQTKRKEQANNQRTREIIGIATSIVSTIAIVISVLRN